MKKMWVMTRVGNLRYEKWDFVMPGCARQVWKGALRERGFRHSEVRTCATWKRRRLRSGLLNMCCAAFTSCSTTEMLARGGRGRVVELAITAKGRKQIEKLAPAWKAAQAAAVKTLGEKRWSAILSDLETAALALNK